MPTTPLDRVPPTALALAAIASVQLGAALARDHFDAVGSLGAAALRLGLGTLVLLAVLRPRPWTWTRRAWLAAVVYGVALGGMNVAIYLSFQTLPIGIAVTVEFLGPLGLALAQTRRWRDAVWALAALVGVALLGLQATGTLDPIGLLWALLAGLCWAGYILASAATGQHLPGTQGLAVAMVVAAAIALPLGSASAVVGVVAEPWLLAVFLGVALLSSALPYALELHALRRLATRVFGVLQSLGPAAAALAGFLILGERLGWPELVALALITIASVGVTLGARRPAVAEAAADRLDGS
ncbi:EamA family transporter [Arenivirga flava]|uniref:Threonine transporter RhtB n=1 Tax=Arenivirga flava TaxID=1930060 RepID=A0AA37UKM2_9MICO|nr:EamA family transporter [Arenivirga flava]GMA28212.1 threonine transporter RhtB [Arenivirga flava]